MKLRPSDVITVVLVLAALIWLVAIAAFSPFYTFHRRATESLPVAAPPSHPPAPLSAQAPTPKITTAREAVPQVRLLKGWFGFPEARSGWGPTIRRWPTPRRSTK